MEMGRGMMTGIGALWMDLEDAAVAQNVHGAVIDRCQLCDFTRRRWRVLYGEVL